MFATKKGPPPVNASTVEPFVGFGGRPDDELPPLFAEDVRVALSEARPAPSRGSNPNIDAITDPSPEAEDEARDGCSVDVTPLMTKYLIRLRLESQIL